MLGAARAYAEANQAVMMTPFILAGAMSPSTVAGAVTQTLAESLAGLAYVQLVRPGAPVILGSFASSMSMQSGAPTFGTPEPALVLYAMAALARRLGVPFRSGGALTASKVADAQAAYESANTMQPTMLGGVNFVLHAAGWLEGGLSMGYEKFVLDADQLGMWHAFAAGIDLSENGQALEAVLSNEPGTHFLGHPHTLANFETAFYRSPIADNSSFEQWESEGARDAATRANEAWKRTLAEYEAPPIDDAVDEELREWIERGRRRRSRTRTCDGGRRLVVGDARRRAPRDVALRGDSARRRRGAGAGARPGRRHGHDHRLPDARVSSRRSRSPARLAAHGYEVVPHLSARLVRDERRARGDRRPAAGARISTISSSSPATPREPEGEFAGAAELLDALEALGRPFARLGITGYPESHPLIDDETTIASMFAKARHATYIVSQVCFDPAVTALWIDDVWTRGTRLPIYVGIPGVVGRAKLLRVSTRIGIGDSLRFLRKNGELRRTLAPPGRVRP